MSSSELHHPSASADVESLVPIERIRSRWPVIFAGAMTLLMVAGLARELLDHGLQALWRHVPASPAFYLAFALLYMSAPTFDWLIFRRLWGLPAAGLVALVKKRIANEVVVGYSGDAYFYVWARARMKMVAAPFGAVKDVTILSAVAGNLITLAMVVVSLPIARGLMSPDMFKMVAGSAAVTLAISLPFIVFSRRVFSLPRRMLWWIFNMHSLRLAFGSLMIAVAWAFAMPDVTLGMWLFLAAARLLVSRLPLVPNKDLLFANFAILLIGQGAALSDLMAFTAALTLAVHVALIGVFALYGLVVRKHRA
ncbi:hypothetical protein ASE86_00315 [Sphingomonas sp. Leaf33]|uniref:hypothetical protein n=1 Tax=Sphingomonas sp. Leaf33 TaxID=1736215 RepID=UPI0006FB91A9|nr:hypothetical protein [Sphingomonas sp. Leaf33]KQN24785.1 hypothetical protein ASE86_00315 [Sphingomonas sp. Leaf33]